MAEFKNTTRFLEDLIRNDYNAAVDLGIVQGVESDAKFGHCPDTTNTPTDVWERGAVQPIYVYPLDAGETVQARSDNPADTNTLKIQGLDVAGLFQEAEITLNGTTIVAIPGVWRAINRVFNSNGTAYVGNVFVEGDGAGGSTTNIFAQIAPDDQQSSQAIFMTPADRVARINNFSTAVNRTQGVDLAATMRLAVQLPSGVFRTQIRYGIQKEGVSNISSDLIVGIPLPPLTKIKISGDPSSTNTDISAEWSMHLYDTEILGSDAVAKIESFWS